MSSLDKVVAARAILSRGAAPDTAAVFASAVSVARYREALVLTRARLARGVDEAAQAPRRKSIWLLRLLGLALVLISLIVFYGLTVPGGTRYGYLFSGILAVCGTFFGMPLLVAGRVGNKD